MLNYTTRVGRIGEITYLADKVRQLADGRIRFDLPTGAFQGACIDLGKLGFGLYTCEIQGRIDALPVHAVFSPYLYADPPGTPFELDFEQSLWGDQNQNKGQMLSLYGTTLEARSLFPTRAYDKYKVELGYFADRASVRCWGLREPTREWVETAYLYRARQNPLGASFRISLYNRAVLNVARVVTSLYLNHVRFDPA